MVRKTRISFLFLGLVFSVLTQAQNFTRHNWYFANSDQALVFGKAESAELFLEDGKVPQTNTGEKLTATDPTTGDLLFYSDGINIYDATNAIMSNGTGLTTAPNAVQALALSPVPGAGNESLYYIFHRNAAGEILYTLVDMSVQGNRATGPPAGAVALG